MLDAARVYARFRECLVARLEFVITQPGKSRLAVDDLALSKERDAGVVNMYRETSQSDTRSTVNRTSCGG